MAATEIQEGLLKNVNLLKDLYSNTISRVRSDGMMSDWFEVSAWVRQGCILAPELFLEPTD